MAEFELVLPCYNESKSIETIVTRAAQAAEAVGYSPEDFRLVLVENGSKDSSRQVMAQLQETALGKWFRVVLVPVNQGYGFGLWAGLSTTQARFVGWSHADQQCDPKDAFTALSLLKERLPEKTLVKGVRTGRNWKDHFVSSVFWVLARLLLGVSCSEINAQPKVFERSLLSELKDPPKTFAFDLYVLFKAVKAGYRIRTFGVFFPPRIHGVSNWAATFFGRYRTILGMIRYMWSLRQCERKN